MTLDFYDNFHQPYNITKTVYNSVRIAMTKQPRTGSACPYVRLGQYGGQGQICQTSPAHTYRCLFCAKIVVRKRSSKDMRNRILADSGCFFIQF